MPESEHDKDFLISQLKQYARDLSEVYKRERQSKEFLEVQNSNLAREQSINKFLEETLFKREALLNHVFDTVPTGLGVIDEKGEIILRNKSLTDMLQLEESDKSRQAVNLYSFLSYASADTITSDGQAGGTAKAKPPIVSPKAIDGATMIVRGRGGRPLYVKISANQISIAKDQMIVVALDNITKEIEAEERISRLGELVDRAQEEERERLSQELHDDLGQHLYGLKLVIDAQRLSAGHAQSVFNEMLEIVNDAIKKTRHISHDLSPIGLKKVGISYALQSLAEKYTTHGKIKLVTQIEDLDGHFSESWDSNVFYIAQEALRNIMNHSQADIVSIKFEGVTGENESQILRLEISDNGVGFASDKIKNNPNAGIGTFLMHRRARALDAGLSVKSRPGHGTEVILEIPR